MTPERKAKARALMVRGTWNYALTVAASCEQKCLLLMLMAFRAWLAVEDQNDERTS